MLVVCGAAIRLRGMCDADSLTAAAGALGNYGAAGDDVGSDIGGKGGVGWLVMKQRELGVERPVPTRESLVQLALAKHSPSRPGCATGRYVCASV
jgi:hypothetical protein